MRKIFYFILFICFKQAVAQTVIIPDTNFVTYLRATIPTAINGNQLDINNPAVTSLTTINCCYKNISNLEGIQYFSSLSTLTCSNNRITNIPNLPASLQIFMCNTNSLTAIPSLPNTLRVLECGGNYLTALPTLPTSLTFLYCSYNNLTCLPSLPNNLTGLDCWNNALNNLPALPSSLTVLSCHHNNISCFPNFPNSITQINISFNPFNCIPNRIDSMDSLTLTYPLCKNSCAEACPSVIVLTSIIIPNIFTPNGDSVNDTFFVKGTNLTNFSCKIFDRWGGLLYQWTDINSGWNGKDKNGTASNDGTYYYIISYTDNAGKANNKNGFFQLIR